jgi:exodeoxyribonuclease-5
MIFTKQQEEIISRGVDFIFNSSNQVFEYDGEAGTGKSVVLFEILKRSGFNSNEILPMAYTGQAAIVMRTKGFYNASTIHSSIYEIKEDDRHDSNGNIIMDTHFNTPVVTDKFVLKERLDPHIKIIVMDEGYMVPDYMKSDIESFGLKIIVTGDQGQLPPVASSPAYLYNEDIPHLTDLMRQSSDDGIVYLARRARNGLPIHTGLYGNALVIEESDLNDKMILASDIVLCGTNNKRDQLNSYIRGNLFGYHDTLPRFGERMICRKNHSSVAIDGICLANGLIGTVSQPPDVSMFDGHQYVMDFMPNLLNKSFIALPCNYDYLIGDIDERNKIRSSKYTRGELFEYAYSSTTHLSQGSEHNGGIYIEEPMGSNIQNKLNYTGITRFKKWLIYVKPNRIYY